MTGTGYTHDGLSTIVYVHRSEHSGSLLEPLLPFNWNSYVKKSTLG